MNKLICKSAEEWKGVWKCNECGCEAYSKETADYFNQGHDCPDGICPGKLEPFERRVSIQSAEERIKELEASRDALKELLAQCYNWREDPPCKICGYNGPEYFDGTVHECAATYHLLALAAAKKEKER